MRSLLSWLYINQANDSWRMLFKHCVPCAFVFAVPKAGSSMAASIAIMAMTTRSSINVNAHEQGELNVSAPASWSAPVLWRFCNGGPIKSAGGLGKPNCNLGRASAGKHSKTCPTTGRFMESHHANSGAHWDHEPLTAWIPGFSRPKPFEPPKGGTPNQPRFMGSLHVLIGAHWDHERQLHSDRGRSPSAGCGWREAMAKSPAA